MNEKALYYRAKAFHAMDKLDDSIKDLRRALQKNPNNGNAIRMLKDIEKQKKRYFL